MFVEGQNFFTVVSIGTSQTTIYSVIFIRRW